MSLLMYFVVTDDSESAMMGVYSLFCVPGIIGQLFGIYELCVHTFHSSLPLEQPQIHTLK